MFAIICLSIAFIANSLSIFFLQKETSKLRKCCTKLEAECHYMSLDSVDGITIGELRAATRLQRFLESIDDSKRVPETVPDNE